MAFIQQSRLVRTATRNVDDTITFHDPPLQVARFPGIVRSRESALMALSPVPPVEQWGGYALEYDPLYTVTTYVAGIHGDVANRLVVLYDVWPDEASRAANPTNPPLQDAYAMILNTGLNANQLRAQVLAKVQQGIIAISLLGTFGDRRDPRLVISQTDPTGILGRANPLNNTTRTVNTRIDTAPELPNPEAAP